MIVVKYTSQKRRKLYQNMNKRVDMNWKGQKVTTIFHEIKHFHGILSKLQCWHDSWKNFMTGTTTKNPKLNLRDVKPRGTRRSLDIFIQSPTKYMAQQITQNWVYLNNVWRPKPFSIFYSLSDFCWHCWAHWRRDIWDNYDNIIH